MAWGKMRRVFAFCVAFVACAQVAAPAQEQLVAPPASWRATAVGPPRGALFLGGGKLGEKLLAAFLQLAGGPDVPLVVIPTARKNPRKTPPVVEKFRALGAKNIALLHAANRAEASSDQLLAPLRAARAVWLCGGRQWRLVDAYLHTPVHRELFALLDRGGVVGGSSAGASIQASFLVRGSPQGNRQMIAPGYEEGFGFLRGVAVDQHVIARGRLHDMVQVLRAHPDLLGIGIDENTAIVVRGDSFEVLGESKVAVYTKETISRAGEEPYILLSPGARYDMRRRLLLADE